MCELCPQWVFKKDLTREHIDNTTKADFARIEENMGKKIGSCLHDHIVKLNSTIFCYDCSSEINIKPDRTTDHK